METDRIFPDNWKDIIQDKKVIFYNTSIGSLLSGREKRIEKMKWVFDVFRKHPEVVLWWRPHPLEFATIKSMAWELRKQYIELRKWYEDNQVGILDESADLHRAIAISDAYYGDWSSVVQLYKAANKPVMYENMYIKNKEDTIFLPVTFCVKDNTIWFIQLDSNKLIKMDRTTYEVEKMICIPAEPPFWDREYNYHIIDVGDSLFLLLGNSGQIYEYEIKTDLIRVHRPQISNFAFHSEIVIERNHRLVMFPYGDNRIFEYNYHSDVFEERKFDFQRIKAAKCYEVTDSKLYMVDSGTNALYCYDMINHSCTKVHIGASDSKYWGVKKAGGYFVLPHMEKRAITLWNERTGEVTELIDFPGRYVYLEEYAYLDMFESGGDIYLFPFCANMILKIDIGNKTIIQVFPEVFFEPDYNKNSENMSGEAYLCVKRYHDYIYAYATNQKSLHIFDMQNMNMQSFPFPKMKNAEQLGLIECLLDDEVNEKSFCEGERVLICTLDNYITSIYRRCEKNSRDNEQGRSIGQDIYRSIMDC